MTSKLIWLAAAAVLLAQPAAAQVPAPPPPPKETPHIAPPPKPGTEASPVARPRFPQLTMEQLTPQQKPLGEDVMRISSVGLGGPYNILLRSPLLEKRLFDTLYYLRWQTSVPTRLNEFAILVISRPWRSQVEWAAHAPLAEKAGLSPAVVAQLKEGKRPAGMAEDEAVVYDFITELMGDKKLADATFARAKKAFTDQQIVDLTGVAGQYESLAMLLAMGEQSVPAGRPEPFKPGEK